MKCPHCGQKLDPNEPGTIRCPKCKYQVDVEPSDINISVELTQDQQDRQDWVDNACYGLLTELGGGKEIAWDMEHISTVREAVQNALVDKLHIMSEMEFYPYIER